MTWNRSQVTEGMSVTTDRGDRLGKVIRCGAETFVVEKGMFSPKDYELRYDHITNIADGAITYSLAETELRGGEAAQADTKRDQPAEARDELAEQRDQIAQQRERAVRTQASAESTDRPEMRIPLMDEEIDIEKVARESGRVRIHKTVKTEQKHITVPVTREDVIIERVSAADGESLGASEAAFQEQVLEVPLHEEEVRVTKHPRVREQMVVRTVIEAVDKEASADLRHEEAEIEDSRPDHLPGRKAPATPGLPPGYGAPGRR